MTLSRLMILSFLVLVTETRAQTTIQLNAVIGTTGTNAATVDGAGNAVNFTGYASDSTTTVLTDAGSVGSSSFNFNTGFADTLDRSIGSSAGAGNVWADLKYDSSSTSPLVLDTNNDGAFADSAVSGFGMHADTFITFDLDVIRANHSLAAATPFNLTGLAGLANPFSVNPTSGAIIVDSTQRAVFDWTSGAGNTLSSYNIYLSGTDRYLTFIGLSGLDADTYYAHVGFADVQLATVPEPSTAAALAGLAALGLVARRRRRA